MGSARKQNEVTDLDEDEVHLGRNQIRVTGVVRERYVEFEYYGGDPCLCIELVMPLAAFHEFRTARDAGILEAAKDADDLYRKLCFGAGVIPLEPAKESNSAG